MFVLATSTFAAASRRCLACVAGVAGILAMAASAQTPTNTPASTNEPQMRLQVVDVETGQPVPDVRVRAWYRAKPTDPSGVTFIDLPHPESDNFSYKITLTKDGCVGQYLTWSKSAGDKIADMPTNYVAKLEKGVAIGGVVQNDNGEPIPGAKITISGSPAADLGERVRTVVGPNYHVERTDAEGKWHFNEAPRDFERLTFLVMQPDYVPAIFSTVGGGNGSENTKLLAKDDYLAGKAVMILGHGLELAGQVVDSSGKPVADAIVTRNHEWRNPAAVLTTDTNGAFKIVNLKKGEMYLTIQSKGLAGQTQLLGLSNGMPDVKIVMAPGKILQGKVVDLKGKAISGATVQMDRVEFSPIEFEWSETTDADGHFAWDSAPDGEHPYLFFASGFHPRSEPAIAADGGEHVITLRPMVDGDQTTVDGRVTDLNSKTPLKEFTIYVKNYTGHAVAHDEQTITNSDGRFEIGVPSASTAYTISIGAPGHRVEASRLKSVGDGDLRMDFALQPDASASGRLYNVQGHFVLNDYKGKIGWTNQQMTFATIVPPPVLAATETEAQQAEFQQFLTTAEGRAWQDAHRNYDVEVESDGSFKVLEVPDGSYHFQVNLRESQEEGGEPIAGLSMDIDVPGSAGKSNMLVDLGTMQLAPKKAFRLGDDAPPFEVKTVDGEPLRLADYKGKYVLLDFWATWCGPCVGEVPYLKSTYKKFGGVDRFVMISLSVDDSPDLPKDFARKNDIKWIQGFLGKWSNSKVTPLYGVEGIPAIFLIGPDGKVLAKELRGDAIKQAVGTALGND